MENSVTQWMHQYVLIAYVTQYHKPLVKSSHDQFVFVFVLHIRQFVSLKWYTVCIQKQIYSLLNFGIFQHQIQLSHTLSPVTQNRICQLYEYFVVHGHKYDLNLQSILQASLSEHFPSRWYVRIACFSKSIDDAYESKHFHGGNGTYQESN